MLEGVVSVSVIKEEGRSLGGANSKGAFGGKDRVFVVSAFAEKKHFLSR